jgi:hypothetical protein
MSSANTDAFRLRTREKRQLPLFAIFALAVGGSLAAACGPSPAQEEARRAAAARQSRQTLDKLEAGDRTIFAKAGFDIVARTGQGACWSDGAIYASADYGADTDLGYVLQKPGSDATYTACMKHADGRPSMAGLRAVEAPAARAK